MIEGNIKALVPLIRETLTREDLDASGQPMKDTPNAAHPPNQARFRRGL
jgi:hypothetical protein